MQIVSPKFVMASRVSARPIKPSKARAVFVMMTENYGRRWVSVPRSMIEQAPSWWANIEDSEAVWASDCRNKAA